MLLIRTFGEWKVSLAGTNVNFEKLVRVAQSLDVTDDGIAVGDTSGLGQLTERFTESTYLIEYSDELARQTVYSRVPWLFSARFRDLDDGHARLLDPVVRSEVGDLLLLEDTFGDSVLVWPADNGVGHHSLRWWDDRSAEQVAATIRLRPLVESPELLALAKGAQVQLWDWVERTPLPPEASPESFTQWSSNFDEMAQWTTRRATCLWALNWADNLDVDPIQSRRAIGELRKSALWPSVAEGGSDDMAAVSLAASLDTDIRSEALRAYESFQADNC